jgi:histone deacetylase 1/2
MRPIDWLNLSATDTVDAVPTTARQALQDPLWCAAMADEHQALVDNGTWSLVPRPPRANVVTDKWIFRHKFHSDGSLARRKARWVLRGFSQRLDIGYDETFSPVVKPSTIRLVLHIVVSSSWPIRQLDVKNAFLNGTLDEVVYCQQSPGFVDASKPEHVCRLHKSLYGLKQAPCAWYQRFAAYIATMGFVASVTNTSIFVLRSGHDMSYLLLYVDYIIITASSMPLLQRLLDRLHSEFAMTNLGDLHYFLGIAVTRSSDGLFLSQRQYAADILQRVGMSECHSSATPVHTHAKLSASDGDLLPDGTEYPCSRSAYTCMLLAPLTSPW